MADLCEICSKVGDDCGFCGGTGGISDSISRKRAACYRCSGNGHMCNGSKASRSSSSSSSTRLICEKCDKEHCTNDCPHFKDDRGQHPDATTRRGGYISDVSAHPDIAATVVQKDGDGHCLFRSLGNYPNGDQGWSRTMQLRNQIAKYQKDHPTMRVYGTAAKNSTFEEYVLEEKGETMDHYAFLMTDTTRYGGAFEIDAFSKMNKKRVIVYVKSGKVWTPWLVVGEDYGEEDVVRLGFVDNNHYVRLVLNVKATQKLRATEAKAAEEENKRKEKAARKMKKDAINKKTAEAAAALEAAKVATAAKVLADIEVQKEDKRQAETAAKILADEIPQGIRAAADYEKACDLFKKLSPGTEHLCKVSSVRVSCAQSTAAMYSWCSVYCLLWCVRFAAIWVLLWLLATM